MEVVKWNKSKNRRAGFMVSINYDEALKLIKSLSVQLADKNPNSGRIEFYTKKGEYFSIAVDEPPAIPPNELEIGFFYDKITQRKTWPLGGK